jgi:hypothetical protein
VIFSRTVSRSENSRVKTLARFLASFAVCVSGVAAACRGGSDPVRDCLDSLSGSAHDRDAAALFARVTADFQAGDGSSRSDTQALARQLFAAYRRLDVSFSHIEIDRSQGAAQVRARVMLSGEPRGVGGLDALLPRSSAYDFDMRLVPDGSIWKVSWASWRPAAR